MKHVARFTALLCDDRFDKPMKVVCDADIVGFRTTIEYETDEDLTVAYLTRMAMEISNLPVIDHKYFASVKPLWSCCCEK